MKASERCPVCRNDLAEKQVEKIPRGGAETAVVKVSAEVCLHCGERLGTPEQIRRFDAIRRKLECRETEQLRLVGQAYEVA